MKAQARKILALIMAMVMCLSLAAPAFAAESEEAPAEASAPEVVEVVEDEAPEAEEKEEEGELDTQEAPVYVETFALGEAAPVGTRNSDDGFWLKTNEGDNAYYPNDETYFAWDKPDKYPIFVEGTSAPVGGVYVGEPKKTKYTVSVKDEYIDPNAPAGFKKTLEWVLTDTPEVRKSLADEDIEWAELTNSQDWYEGEFGQEYQVKGSIYQEKQSNSKWHVYFKLTPVKMSETEWEFDTSASAKPVYAEVVADFDEKLDTDQKIRAALANAVECDKNGDPVAEEDRREYSLVNIDADKNYNYGVTDADGATVTDGDVTPVEFTGTATTATFKVRVTYWDIADGKTKVETNTEAVKNALSALGRWDGWTVSSITLSGETFTVAIAQDPNHTVETDDVEDDVYGAENVKVYWVNGHKKVGLIDLSKAGYYYDNAVDAANQTAGKKKSIAAGTKLYGEVAVKKTDMPEEGEYEIEFWADDEDADYWYFDSELAMQNQIRNNNCAKTQTIKYVKAIVNEKNGNDKINAYEGGEWAANPDAFKEDADPWTIAKSEEHHARTSLSVVPATCKKAGTAVYTDVCKICGAALGIRTEELPIIVSNVEKATKALNYVVEERVDANRLEEYTRGLVSVEEYVNLPYYIKNVEGIRTECYEDGEVPEGAYQFTAERWQEIERLELYHYYEDGVYEIEDFYISYGPNTDHYIKEELVDTVLATKESKGIITHRYMCNLGEIHDELTWTEEIDKSTLAYSGRWDSIAWGIQNTALVKNPAALYGYSAVTVCDTDLDIATLPLNGDYEHFVAPADALDAQTDGTYFGQMIVEGNINNILLDRQEAFHGVAYVGVESKDANGKKVVTNTPYAATVTVKEIKVGEKDCVDGSAKIEINVYKVTSGFDFSTPEKVAESVKEKTAELVNTFSQPVVVPAEKTHVDANNDGKCDNCSAEINQVAPINENKKDIKTLNFYANTVKFTGKEQKPVVTGVDANNIKYVEGTDYRVEDIKGTNAGTYAVKIIGIGEFEGETSINWTIKPIKATIKKKSAPSKLTSNKNKKKKVTGQIKTKLTGCTISKYKVTKKVTGVSIDKKGKITVKGGLKKGGKFKVKIQGVADESGNYTNPKALTLTVTINAAKK